MSENNKKHTIENGGSAGHTGPEAHGHKLELTDSPCSPGWLDFPKEQMAQLHDLVQRGDFPHLSVYGP